jgi:hypothetical protein
MNGQRWLISLVLVLFTFGVSVPITVRAHHLTVGEVLEILNREEVKAQTGIADAKVDPHLKRHLIIKVHASWFNLPPAQREKLATAWRRMWKDAVKKGVVSVVDAKSNQPVVNYGPNGQASVVVR